MPVGPADYLRVVLSCTTWRNYTIFRELTMSAPISVRLDADVRETLESEARVLGIGLASYLRQLATKAAQDVRRARIRAGSATVAQHVAMDQAARNFMDDWGTPDAEGM